MYANRTQEHDLDLRIKVAVYSEGGEPEVSEISAASTGAAGAKCFKVVVEKVRECKGCVPEKALQELIENLIHADFEGVVISVLEGGNVVRISDKGPGIQDKNRAFEFGFSGARPNAAQEIRGVGAGLGIARAAAEKAGGKVTIEDNIGGGTVVTLSVGETTQVRSTENSPEQPAPRRKYSDSFPKMNISERQQKVLVTVLESGELGPSTVAERLGISVSTAYRDLSVLEEHGLVASIDSGKRVITLLGQDLVEAIISTWVK